MSFRLPAPAGVLVVLLVANAARAAAAAPPDSTLELSALERAVLARNPTLDAMRAAVEEAEARAGAAGGLENPMLDLMAAPRSFGSDEVEPGYRIAVSQRLPLSGRRGLAARAARAEARARAADLEAMRLDLLETARGLYYTYYEVARGQDAIGEQANLMERFRKAALARYAAGLVGQQDPLEAESELAMLDHERVVLERRRRIAVARLNALMHESPDHALPPPPDELPARADLPDGSLRDLAIRQRPELKAATARVEARTAEARRAGREGWPEPAIGVAYDRYWTEPELQTSLTLSFELPLWQGRLGAGRREARAALAMAEATRRAAADSIALQVTEAAADLHEAGHEVEILREKVLPVARRTLEAARGGYESGRGDFLALVNAARNVVRVRLELIEATAEWHRTSAALARAVGTPPEGER